MARSLVIAGEVSYSQLSLSYKTVGLFMLNNTPNDTSGNNNNGTNNSCTATTDQNGVANGAYSFNGTSSYVSIPSATVLNSSVFTMMAWIYQPSIIVNNNIIGPFGNAGPELRIGASGSLTLLSKNIFQFTSSTGTTTAGQWAHVAVTYDALGNVIYYINGQAAGTTNHLLTWTFSNYEIGTEGSLVSPWAGSISGVGFYNYVLTPAQIQNLYTAGNLSILRPLTSSPRSQVTAGQIPYPTIVLADNPTSYWRLDDTTTTLKDYMGLNPGTYNGTYTQSEPSLVAGGDASTKFDGTSGYANIPDAPSLDPTGSFSVECWAQPTTSIGAAVWGLVSKDQGGSLSNPPYVIEAVNGSGQLEFATTNAANAFTAVFSPSVMASGVTQHIVGVYNAVAGNLNIYVNGVGTTPATGSGIGATTTSLKIGQQKAGLARWFPGYIDEVAVYNYALTQAQITNHYQAGAGTILRPQVSSGIISYPKMALNYNPVGLWVLNNTPNDTSGNGNNGTITNATATTNNLGVANGAYAFVGTGNVDVPSTTILNPTAITVNAWFYCTSFAGYNVIVSKVPSGFGTGWEMANTTGGTLRATLRPAGTNLNPGPALVLNTWYMGTLTYDGSSVMNLYQNGVLIGSATGSNTMSSTTDLFIGTRPAGGNFNGSICNVAFYNYVLTANQIMNLYTAGNATILRPLVP